MSRSLIQHWAISSTYLHHPKEPYININRLDLCPIEVNVVEMREVYTRQQFCSHCQCYGNPVYQILAAIRQIGIIHMYIYTYVNTTMTLHTVGLAMMYIRGCLRLGLQPSTSFSSCVSFIHVKGSYDTLQHSSSRQNSPFIAWGDNLRMYISSSSLCFFIEESCL